MASSSIDLLKNKLQSSFDNWVQKNLAGVMKELETVDELRIKIRKMESELMQSRDKLIELNKRHVLYKKKYVGQKDRIGMLIDENKMLRLRLDDPSVNAIEAGLKSSKTKKRKNHVARQNVEESSSRTAEKVSEDRKKLKLSHGRITYGNLRGNQTSLSSANSSTSNKMKNPIFENIEAQESSPYTEVVRKKSEREQLDGFDCPECKKFYDIVALEHPEKSRKQIMNEMSRHRHAHPPPNTPPGYWELPSMDTLWTQ